MCNRTVSNGRIVSKVSTGISHISIVSNVSIVGNVSIVRSLSSVSNVSIVCNGKKEVIMDWKILEWHSTCWKIEDWTEEVS